MFDRGHCILHLMQNQAYTYMCSSSVVASSPEVDAESAEDECDCVWQCEQRVAAAASFIWGAQHLQRAPTHGFTCMSHAGDTSELWLLLRKTVVQ